jgi:hypothetical protein
MDGINCRLHILKREVGKGIAAHTVKLESCSFGMTSPLVGSLNVK